MGSEVDVRDGLDGWLRAYLDDFRQEMRRGFDLIAEGQRAQDAAHSKLEERVRSLERDRDEGRGEKTGLRGIWESVRNWGAVFVTALLAIWTITRGR